MKEQFFTTENDFKEQGQLFLDFTTLYEEKITLANLDCIVNKLPQLFPDQQKDVLKAEQRFQNGKGILFTNGTGSGKTFTALGIAKRFELQNKNNILIVVPTDKKAKDWISEAQHFDLQIHQLKDIKDFRKGITVTTYANFYQNVNILKITYDLVIYDESHYLLQNAQGDFTEALYKHREVANLSSKFKRLYTYELREKAKVYNPTMNKYFVNEDEFEKLYNEKIATFLEKTKVVFLSATPFAYHKSLLIGDGTLWDINEHPYHKKDTFQGYNQPSDYETFFTKNFGYSMKYNKLNRPDAEIDEGLMERAFFEKYRELGVISGRKIQIDQDYSRDFITINSTIGDQIDDGKQIMSTEEFRKEYPLLYRFNYRKFSYQYTNQLLECLKAKDVIDRVQQHLNLNRKVVIFHNYNHSLLEHPFKFNARRLLKGEDEIKNLGQLYREIERFEDNYPELVNLDLNHLSNTRKTLNDNFKNVLEFNGTVSKKKRAINLEKFNDNQSDYNILLVQTKAGKEGISIHDVIGNKQRVLLNLGLPIAPTDAIQIEGRIYRIKLMSNAIYEYITLQTNFERIAFAEKVATRSRTAENLAMGNNARNMELIFKEGYLSSHDELPNLNQGTGGKDSDLYFEEISEFERAKTYYYSILKKNSKTKSREGNDYFATPEPLGYKMVEWLNIKPGHNLLEPSAGHGAIGRFFPENCVNTYIEPSYTLSSELSLNVKGEIKQMRFEELNHWNKYDGIAMNPPFGKNSKLAMEHVEKATHHMNVRDKSRIVSIVPNGTSFDKRLKAFLDNPDNKDIFLKAEILLPSVVFKRASTSVYTKIIILDKNCGDDNYYRKIDLSQIKNVKTFFDDIENLNI